MVESKCSLFLCIVKVLQLTISLCPVQPSTYESPFVSMPLSSVRTFSLLRGNRSRDYGVDMPYILSVVTQFGLWWIRKRFPHHIRVIRYLCSSTFPSSCACHVLWVCSVCNYECIHVINCTILYLCDMVEQKTSQRCSIKISSNRMKEKTRNSQQWCENIDFYVHISMTCFSEFLEAPIIVW